MDDRIQKFIKVSKTRNHRCIFVVLGDKGILKVPILYKLVAHKRPSPVLWFSHNSADLRKICWTTSENTSSKYEGEGNFVPQVTRISFSDIQKVTFPSCRFVVVQDMKNIRPSDVASIVESVPGKGALVFTFSKISEFNKLTSPKLCDVVKSKFMKRLFASLTTCPRCLILDDKLNILFVPVTNHKDKVAQMNTEEPSNFTKDDDDHSEVVDKLIGLCNTEDQSRFLMQSLDALKKRATHCTISASSPGGRGKSVVLGLAIAGAIAFKYSNIFISSLNCNNVKIIFKYLLLGLDALQFKEDEDYDLIQSVNPKFDNALLGLNIFRDHPQAVRFIFPGDVENKLEQAELVVIDEAASMPLPLLKKLLGPYIILMTSTIEGCGGSGKYLYENMISEIRESSLKKKDKTVSLESMFPTSETSSWKQITLSKPINYSNGDAVECWINRLLCLECDLPTTQGCPDPSSCRLFYVCKDTLFSYEPYAEIFLKQLMSIIFSSKRTVSPDIMKIIADDEDYHIFCLLSSLDSCKNRLGDILCVILVHKENRVPWNIVYSGINQSGDLKDCFSKWSSTSKEDTEDFLPIQGIHIVDIATYPSYQRMGYGSQALRLLQEFYEGKCVSLDDKPYIFSCKNKSYATNDMQSASPLLLQLTEVEPDNIDYILVSYFLRPDLLSFWKKAEFIPVYISGERNSSQEHLCFMMKCVNSDILAYLKESWHSFSEYYFRHLSSDLKCFTPELALSLIKCTFSKQLPKEALKKRDIDIYLKPQRMKALEKYCQNMTDFQRTVHCIPILAKLFFRHRFVAVDMPVLQQAILLAVGIQNKTPEDISADLSLSTEQVNSLLNRTIKKLATHLTSIIEKAVEKTIVVHDVNMEPVSQDLDDELEEAAQKIKEKQLEDLKRMQEMDFSEFAIKGSEDDWEKAVHKGRVTLVNIKSVKKEPDNIKTPFKEENTFKHKKKNMKRKRR